jgi:putative DNA primase/helicase
VDAARLVGYTISMESQTAPHDPGARPKKKEGGAKLAGPRKASGVKAEVVQWRWRNRIPKGMITLVAGKPDQGKGLFAAHVAADVSNAGGNVLYSAAEDSEGLMTRPRLEAAGADLDRVHLWRFQLPRHGKELGQHVVDMEIDLIVMDPVARHLSGGVSRHSDNIGSVLKPLTDLIETTGTSVLLIEHALKRVPKSGHPLDAIGGSSSGLPAAARAAFVFGRDPEDEDRRIIAPAKFNLGEWPKAVAFELDTEELDTVGEIPYLMFEEEVVFDAMRLFQDRRQPGKRGAPNDKRAAAAEWLTTYLAENGATAAHTVMEDAKQWNMSRKTLERAAADMGVEKSAGRTSKWDLPDEVKEALGLEDKPDPDDLPKDEPKKASDVTSGEKTDRDTMDDALADLLGGKEDSDES